MQQQQRRRWLQYGAGFLLLIFITPFLLIGYVYAATSDRRYNHPADLPAKPVALVFGAGVYPDGRLSLLLKARVKRAAELYHAGRIEKILMSGDNSRENYDEVTAMEQYALTLGVEPTDITLDYAGFSTYESCYRAKAIFGVKEATLITQGYHLPRAVYTCEHLGLVVVGLETDDKGKYPTKIMGKYRLREMAAILKGWSDVHVMQPAPTFLGPFEGLN